VYVLTAGSSLGGPGIFSLTPSGKLRWSTPERYTRPFVGRQELEFGRTPDRRGWQFVYSANGHLARVDIRTGKRTTIPLGTRAQPIVGADDSIYCGTVAYDSAGRSRWRSQSSIGAVASNGDVFGLRGNLFRSDDAGETWRAIETGTVAILNAGLRLADGTIVIAGTAGALLVSRDGGETVSLVERPDRQALATVLEAGDDLILIGEFGANKIPLADL